MVKIINPMEANLMLSVQRLMNRQKPKAGHVGVEIEVEGAYLPQIGSPLWQTKEDHSLRVDKANERAYEYILNEPLNIDHVEAALKEWYEEFSISPKCKPNVNSTRTSVHVHLNCQDLVVQQIYTLICLYLIFEDFLVSYSGPERVGNMYCLRYSDADYLPLRLIRDLRLARPFRDLIANDAIRYSALNLYALSNFGSVEFRSFRGTVNPKEIQQWTTVLWTLFNAAKKFNSPLDILESFDDLHRKEFVKLIWENCPYFEEYILDSPMWQTRMHKGYLFSFEIAHALHVPCKWILDLATRLKDNKPAVDPYFLKKVNFVDPPLFAPIEGVNQVIARLQVAAAVNPQNLNVNNIGRGFNDPEF